MTKRLCAAETELDQLVARYVDDGDVDALGELFDATAPALFRVALGIAPDAAAAEDALQEAFLAAVPCPVSRYVRRRRRRTAASPTSPNPKSAAAPGSGMGAIESCVIWIAHWSVELTNSWNVQNVLGSSGSSTVAL